MRDLSVNDTSSPIQPSAPSPIWKLRSFPETTMSSVEDISEVVTHFVAQAKRTTIDFLIDLLDADVEDGRELNVKNGSSETKLHPLQRWFLDHLSHPYPPLAVKRQFACELGLSVRNIDRRFTNWRRRTRWTEIKRKWANGTTEGMAALLAQCASGEERRPEVLEAVRQLHLHFEADKAGEWIEEITHAATSVASRTPSLVLSPRSVSGSSWSSDGPDVVTVAKCSRKRRRASDDCSQHDQEAKNTPRPMKRRCVPTAPKSGDTQSTSQKLSPSLSASHYLTNVEPPCDAEATRQLISERPTVFPATPAMAMPSRRCTDSPGMASRNMNKTSQSIQPQVWPVSPWFPHCLAARDLAEAFSVPCNIRPLPRLLDNSPTVATPIAGAEARAIEFDWFSLLPDELTPQ